MNPLLKSFRSTEVRTVTLGQQLFAGAIVDILINIVVLNLFVEFVDEVIIDSFIISVLTAVLLTAMLKVIAGVEHQVHHFFFEVTGWRVTGFIAIWLILFGSKFLMLEVVDWVFGDHVSLGHLIEVILIVLAMIVCGQLLQVAYDRLGVEDPTAGDGSD